MKPLFHPSLYQFDQAQPSYWEASAGQPPASYQALKGDHSCDVAIIGGGYTGLSAALHLARDFNVDVCLLEAGHIGWGASGRNGGFCAMGMTKLSLESQLKKFGAEQTRAFHQSQAEAETPKSNASCSVSISACTGATSFARSVTTRRTSTARSRIDRLSGYTRFATRRGWRRRRNGAARESTRTAK
jgi:glycine/D-amino acid oxidase-like deaminating enzyme